MDCMEFMRGLPDKFFNLAVADPPYGIGESGGKNETRGGLAKAKKYKPFSGLDKEPMPKQFFDELFRVSKNQIIWGANHFMQNMPYGSPCWVVWDKENAGTDFADCELAWTSFKTSVRKFKFKWQGMLQGNMRAKEIRIHPTQKPIALYAWLLENYAKPDDKIFDPMLGSGSSRIAAYKLGFDFWGCELHPEYFEKAEKRFRESIAMPLFDEPNPNQIAMFEQ